MHKLPADHRRTTRGGIIFALLLTAANGSAQTVGSVDELRDALKKDLTPLGVSFKEQAREVAADLARSVLSGLAGSMTVTAPQPRFARRDGVSSEKDPS